MAPAHDTVCTEFQCAVGYLGTRRRFWRVYLIRVQEERVRSMGSIGPVFDLHSYELKTALARHRGVVPARPSTITCSADDLIVSRSSVARIHLSRPSRHACRE